MQGVAEAESRFFFIDIGAYDKQSDGGTFSGSILYHFLEDSESTLTKPASFEGSGTEMPFFSLGDKAYPVKTYLMKSFARKDVMWRTCFQLHAVASKEMPGVYVWYPDSKMAIVNKAIEMKVNAAERTVRCICVLHNIIIDLEEKPTIILFFKKLHKFMYSIRPKRQR